MKALHQLTKAELIEYVQHIRGELEFTREEVHKANLAINDERRKLIKPEENGFYWLIRQDGARTIVKIYGIERNDPTVSFIGSDWDRDLDEVSGKFIGPIELSI